MYTALSTGLTGGSSRGERTYGELKRGLLLGEFPLGTRLAEERLASALGVSRTPVREALSRLHAEGFVVRLPDGGFGPAAPDLDAVRELYEVRRGLELLALRRTVDDGAPHDNDQLALLRDEWRALQDQAPEATPDPSFVLLDEDFHVRLAAASGNLELVTLLQSVNERIRLVRIYDFLTPERIVATIEQHLTIVETALTVDTATAAEHLDAHLSESLAVVEPRAAAALARMIGGRTTAGTPVETPSRDTTRDPSRDRGGPA